MGEVIYKIGDKEVTTYEYEKTKISLKLIREKIKREVSNG